MLAIVFFLLPLFLVGHHFYMLKMRKEAIRDSATSAGLAHGLSVQSRISARFCSTQLFGMGLTHMMDNAFEAETDGVRISVFDYTVCGAHKNSISSQTVVAVECECLKLPLFAMLPFRAFGRLRANLDWPQIELESDTVLSAMFSFYAPDSKLVDMNLTDSFRDYVRRNPELYFESTHGAFLLCFPGKPSSGYGLTEQFALGHEVLDILLENVASTSSGDRIPSQLEPRQATAPAQ